ncbi:SGNH/GDSL hydrolase family protein [Ravibacter arvi]|uniref:SGNH/GDSL hydrolase family protein n=1 Tax=Ravibacter arvi TaxID=2051041 RepID=A0ABP8LUQ5_9BACT
MKSDRRKFLKIAGGLLAALPSGAFPLRVSKPLPRVLILGDSISIGYTPHVVELLKEVAEVSRPAENCQGTTNGVKKIDTWLGDSRWDVIHFNFGLHDLKHVDPVTFQNSTREEDPKQADVKQYARNLKAITEKLKSTGAVLIFATTTPFPDKPDGPLRRASDVKAYNRAALKIMKKNGVLINDLHSFALPRMSALQIPKNVHFTKEGSKVLAEQVAGVIRKEIR